MRDEGESSTPLTLTLTSVPWRGWGWGAFSKIRSRARSFQDSFDPARYMLWDHGPVESWKLSGLRPVSGGPCRTSEPVGGGMLERHPFLV